MKNFNLSEPLQKTKNKLFTVSLIAIIMGNTEEIPSELSIIGVNLQGTNVIGLVVLAILTYLLLSFVIFALLENHPLFSSKIIANKQAKATSNTLGLTLDEIDNSQMQSSNNDYEKGTMQAEREEYYQNANKIADSVHNNINNTYRRLKICFDFIIPVLTGLVAEYSLIYLVLYIYK